MFEAELKQKFKDIFALSKVTYNSPGDSPEQGCLFIDVEDSRNVITDDRAKGMVRGTCSMYSQHESLPFGFFSKKIAAAAKALKKDMFFFEMDKNRPRYQNLVQRGFSFIYFFNCEHDPNDGTITSVTTDIEFTEE